jgi:hypothetical protein
VHFLGAQWLESLSGGRFIEWTKTNLDCSIIVEMYDVVIKCNNETM